MSKDAMAGAVTLCGVGLCMIGGALLMQNGQQAHAAGVPAAAAMVASAANAQACPTVVWYGLTSQAYSETGYALLLRAWSDGTVEGRVCLFYRQCEINSCQAWHVISSPNQGFKAAADINADELVNGVDLASLLSNWGDAPRVPFPPSDCPLNLINP